MLELYPLLVETAIEFKIESRKIIQRHKDGRPAVLTPDVFICPLAEGFRIQQHNQNFYCLKDDQSSKYPNQPFFNVCLKHQSLKESSIKKTFTSVDQNNRARNGLLINSTLKNHPTKIRAVIMVSRLSTLTLITPRVIKAIVTSCPVLQCQVLQARWIANTN